MLIACAIFRAFSALVRITLPPGALPQAIAFRAVGAGVVRPVALDQLEIK
jgi:hypothetical protein